MQLILASQSQRRRELLTLMGLNYKAVISDADENAPDGLAPDTLVCALAKRKAQAVLPLYPDDCVIGADTVVYIDDEIIGKPRDKADAARILKRLRGRSHIVYTGVAVLKRGYCDVCHTKTRVTFAQMTDSEIHWYVNTGEPMDKAGAYGIQGPGGIFVEKVEGNYFTVIGMPLPLLYRMLVKAGAMALE